MMVNFSSASVIVALLFLVLCPAEVATKPASFVTKTVGSSSVNINVPIATGNNTQFRLNQTSTSRKKKKMRRRKKQSTTSRLGEKATATKPNTKPDTKPNTNTKPDTKPNTNTKPKALQQGTSSKSKSKDVVVNETARQTKKQPKISKGSPQGGQEAATLRRIKREWKDAVKLRIAYDWIRMKDVAKETDDEYSYVRIGPYGNNLLRWHFSIMGTPNSEYEGGIYHGRVLLPKDYPGSPPRVQLLTPSGRFIPGHDICLSASNYHPESWTPKWTVLSLVEALRIHMITQANEIGGTTATPAERRKYARLSRSWAAGKLSHEKMISQGVFQWEDSSDSPSSNSLASIREQQEDELDIGVHLAAIRSTDSPQLTEHLRSDGTLAVLVEVFKSPARLAILILLALFAVLNIK